LPIATAHSFTAPPQQGGGGFSWGPSSLPGCSHTLADPSALPPLSLSLTPLSHTKLSFTHAVKQDAQSVAVQQGERANKPTLHTQKNCDKASPPASFAADRRSCKPTPALTYTGHKYSHQFPTELQYNRRASTHSNDCSVGKPHNDAAATKLREKDALL
jgi:hypothetical protein